MIVRMDELVGDEKIYTMLKIKELEEQRDELNKQLFTANRKDEFLGNIYTKV